MKHFSSLTIRLTSVLLAFLLITPTLFLSSQEQSIQVVRGERPPVDLSTVKASDYEQGILLIKFKEQYSDFLENNPVSQNENGQIRFHMEAVDLLNDIHQVRNVKQEFLNPALYNAFTTKHKAWGFHLWYKLEFDTDADIISIVQNYQALDEIAIAEPEYRKMLIEGMSMDITDPESNASQAVLELLEWTPNDPSFGNQWHYHNTGQSNGTAGADIDLKLAWDIEKGNPLVVVAIVDDGIQYNHPDLADNIWPDIGFNFVNNTSNINPGSHGTHVAGTVAAVTNNNIGVSGIAGGDGSGNGIRLMSAQVFMGGSSGGFHLAPVWAADNGAAISQNSWGYTSPNVYNQNVLDAIDYFNINGGGDAMTDGGITIFAAGNSNSSANYYPGFYSGAFSVAGTNNQDAKAWYSNYGTWIDISAPGGETNSVSSRGVLSTVTNSGYSYFQGTSMACPHVSGVAALVLSYAYGQLTVEDLKQILLNSVDDHYGSNPSYIGMLGAGRLNAYQALIEAQDYSAAVMNPMTFNADSYNSSEITLSWSKNQNEDDVLLVWSPNDIFGSPDSGMIYQANTVLPGGGIILYVGNEFSFLHTDLFPATSYFYKIWSYDSIYQYSSGRNTFATTQCELYVPPIFEGFEGGNNLPFCWNQQYVEGDHDWEFNTGNGGNNPPDAFQGNFNALFKAQDAEQSGYITQLQVPLINLAPYESAELTFAFTNAIRTEANQSFQDILRVKFKPSQNADWETLAVYESDVSQWTEVLLTIPVHSSTSYIAFEAESGRGHGVCIDNIAVVAFGNVPTYEITSSTGMNGSIVPHGSFQIGQGGAISYQIQANNNYSIDSLIVDDQLVVDASGETSYTYTFTNVAQDHSIFSNFTVASYNVVATVTPEAAGIIDGSGSYPMNSPVSLLAIENPGYSFSRWLESGNVVSYDNPYEFNLINHRNITALFTPIIYTVQAQANPPEGGNISGGGSFLYGSAVELTANPAESYLFVEWLEDGDVISTNNPFSFSAEDDRFLTARFELGTFVLNDTPGNGLKIFPNPSDGILTLELVETSIVQVMDLTGRIVYKRDAEPGTVILDLSDNSKGLYFIMLYQKNNVITRKIVIK
jgi:subtilisin family serine protease